MLVSYVSHALASCSCSMLMLVLMIQVLLDAEGRAFLCDAGLAHGMTHGTTHITMVRGSGSLRRGAPRTSTGAELDSGRSGALCGGWRRTAAVRGSEDLRTAAVALPRQRNWFADCSKWQATREKRKLKSRQRSTTGARVCSITSSSAL